MAISQFLRPVTVLAGGLGVFQALIWISLAIVGIMTYYCVGPENESPSNWLGQGIIFFYFNGEECTSQNTATTTSTSPATSIHDPTTKEILLPKMSGDTVNVFMWLYLVLSFFWLLSSGTLLMNVTIDKIKHANYFLYTWVFLTFALSILDLAFGILFGLDYNFIITTTDAVSAVVPGLMMTFAFRGFLLWVVNIALASYLFVSTFAIFDHNKRKDGINHAFTSSRPSQSFRREPPIDAYGYTNRDIIKQPPWQERSMQRSESRADDYKTNAGTHNSARQFPQMESTSPWDQRDSNLPAVYRTPKPKPVAPPQVYPKPGAFNRGFSYPNAEEDQRQPKRNEPSYPVPDYSPPLPRSNVGHGQASLKSALKNNDVYNRNSIRY